MIKLLDKNTIDKIAAGEVIDRPASIVKELVENSIDAGSSAVSVEIKDGGKSLIRITDNGSGIAADQIGIAFLRHSTSKINDASDLSFISTLGFRGEALSSIAAVSRTELCTKTEDSLTGVIYKINGGTEESVCEAGLPEGTTIIVRDLFYNTPARLKFLKSDQTEAGYILDTVQRIALSRPDISFKFTSNGSVRLSTSGNGILKDTIYSVFGRDITANLLEINDGNDILRVEGFTGKPEIARGNRSFEFFYINGRYIKDRIIQKALEDAYTGYQMKGTFPFAVLNIIIEPELIDVNVHPSKMEIRFFNNETVFESIYEIIRKRITSRENIPEASFKDNTGSMKHDTVKQYIPEPFEKQKDERLFKLLNDFPVKNAPHFSGNTGFYSDDIKYNAGTSENITEDSHTVSAVSLKEDDLYAKGHMSDDNSSGCTSDGKQSVFPADRFLSEASRPMHRIIGEVFDTYWLVEFDGKLYIIDQHAAHEKVLYERFMKKLKNGDHYSQYIIPPIIVTLSPREMETAEKYKKQFYDIGFEFEHFGGSEYSVSAVPADIYSTDSRQLFMTLLSELSDISAGTVPDIITDRAATAACRAAVKGGTRLSHAEADRLIDELLTLDNPYNCPHGRPTIITMSRYELEKKFKRII
ncbi:MAG: DNA mismatch repair endonuclease MutL [Parasporobacterium sp.]|nr:DNA mismatch repair endonuclease MutL [Parasporobacterium sp.]